MGLGFRMVDVLGFNSSFFEICLHQQPSSKSQTLSRARDIGDVGDVQPLKSYEEQVRQPSINTKAEPVQGWRQVSCP